MPPVQRVLLDKAKMINGLATLDVAMGSRPMIFAFSPITVISPGGFLAVTYFGNRTTTEDIDIIVDQGPTS